MKKTILLASTGSRDTNALENFIAIKNNLEKTFPFYSFEWIFTSNRIRSHLPDNSSFKKPISHYLNLHNNNEIIIKFIGTFHITPSKNFLKMKDEVNKSNSNIKMGAPLLDFAQPVAEEIYKFMYKYQEKDSATILIAHGDEDDTSEKSYLNFLNEISPLIPNIHIMTLHGNRYFANYIKILNKKNIKKCLIFPLMLNSGKHVKNDILGSQKSSIINTLKDNGTNAKLVDSNLGSIPGIMNIWYKNIAELIDN